MAGKSLTQLLSVTNQSKPKSMLWTDAEVHAFQVFKRLGKCMAQAIFHQL